MKACDWKDSRKNGKEKREKIDRRDGGGGGMTGEEGNRRDRSIQKKDDICWKGGKMRGKEREKSGCGSSGFKVKKGVRGEPACFIKKRV